MYSCNMKASKDATNLTRSALPLVTEGTQVIGRPMAYASLVEEGTQEFHELHELGFLASRRLQAAKSSERIIIWTINDHYTL